MAVHDSYAFGATRDTTLQGFVSLEPGVRPSVSPGPSSMPEPSIPSHTRPALPARSVPPVARSVDARVYRSRPLVFLKPRTQVRGPQMRLQDLTTPVPAALAASGRRRWTSAVGGGTNRN